MKKYLVVLEDQETGGPDELFYETDSEFSAYDSLSRAINLGDEGSAFVVTGYSKEYYSNLIKKGYYNA